MSNNLLGLGVSGLKVSQSGLSTVGHNIANSSTEGYSRQRIDVVTNPEILKSGNYFGNGANVDSVQRVANSFVTGQLRTDTTLFSDLDGYYDQIRQLDTLLADESTGLSSSLNSFFSALHNGADDPTAISARQLVIDESENLADRFNTLYGRLEVLQEGIDSGMEVAVERINALVADIAQLNLKISEAAGLGNGDLPNDLLDKREMALKDLAAFVPTQIFDQGNGQINVLIGSGQSVVVGTDVRRLTLAQSIADASKMDVYFQNGNNIEPIGDLIKGGELGGLLRFRDETLENTYKELGRTAIALADSFNRAHQQGLDLESSFGGLFFNDINDREVAENRVIAASTNSVSSNRSLALNISDPNQLTTSDYKLRFESGGLYRITRESDGKEIANGILSGVLPKMVSFDGVELEFTSGSFQSGDSFTLHALRSGAKDIHSALASGESLAFASPILTDGSLGNTGSGKISSGELLALEDADGNPLPLFADAGQMNPPLIVVFNSPTSYDILDNSDPGNPVHLDPPIRDQTYIPGIRNNLFATDAGQTQVSTDGEIIGLPDGSVAVNQPLLGFDGSVLVNGYPSELISFVRAPTTPTGQPIVSSVITGHNASAAEIATQLNAIPGVQANAMAYAEITDLNLTEGSPLQISLNGQDLIEYDIDPLTLLPVFAPEVPDPATETDAFYDYLANRINQNVVLTGQGIFAIAAADATTGATELHLHSSSGGDLKVGLIAGLTDSISVNDGEHLPVVIAGQGEDDIGHVVVGGKLDVRLADGVTIDSIPPDSLLFGNPDAAGFALPSYLGIQAQITGSPQVGDRFTLDFNQDAALDNRNVLNLVNLKDAKILAGGVKTLSSSYASLVQQVGIETSSTKINRDAAEQVLQQTEALRNSISGVNLDEEAADLIRFEQLFSANAQVISVARDIFDRLINSF